MFGEGRLRQKDRRVPAVAVRRRTQDAVQDRREDFGIGIEVGRFEAAFERGEVGIEGVRLEAFLFRGGAERFREGIIIEALASEAYRTVTPVLKENYLKRKITRDAESADMIDYVVRNRVFDMAYVNMHDGVGSYVRDLLASKSTDISSTFKKYAKTAKKRVESIVKAFDKSLQS